jgi:hypothetical protein
MKLYRLNADVVVPAEFEICKQDNYYFVHVLDDQPVTKIGYYPYSIPDKDKNDKNYLEIEVLPENVHEVFYKFKLTTSAITRINERIKENGDGAEESLIGFRKENINGLDFEDIIFQDSMNKFLRKECTQDYLFSSANIRTIQIINKNITLSRSHISLPSNLVEHATPIVDTYKRRAFRLKSLTNSDLRGDYSSSGMNRMFGKDWYFIDTYLGYYRNNHLRSNSLTKITEEGYNKSVTLTDPDSEYSFYYQDLEEVDYSKKDERENITWSAMQTSSYNLFSDYISQQIRTRYAMYDRPKNGYSNIVIDSFVPRALYQSNLDPIKAKDKLGVTKTSIAISPFFANLFGVKQMEIEQLCRIIGYEPKMIKKLFDQVKREKFSVMFIGYGGTNINTVYWLNEMAKMVNSINVFEYASIWEKEETEFSNILRFPINPASIMKQGERENYSNISKKTNILQDQLDRLVKGDIEIIPDYYYPETGTKSGMSLRQASAHKLDENGEIKLKNKKYVIYGAPNIATRQELSKYGNFISATHGNNGCMLYINPEQNTSLQVESYGIIQLAGFFMNQLRMAIGFLELLADPEVDLSEFDKHYMSYEFTGADAVKEDGTKIAIKPDREYRFQLQHNGLIMTEEQAAGNNTNQEPQEDRPISITEELATEELGQEAW